MPAGAPLFGNIQSRSQSKNLVECKAGKMTLKGKMVHPDKRKGLLYVYQSDDSLMHFCWKDRQSGTVEDDLIIFPDDCEFKRVTQCTTGRVYVLKFKSSNRKFFFWIQEPKTDKDEENCRRINEVLNNPPTPGSQRSGGGTPDGDLQSLLNNMSQQQLMQLFGGVGQIGGLSSLLGTMGRRGPSSGTQGSSRSGTTTSTTSSASATTGSTTTTSSSAPAVTTTTAAQPAVSTAGKETSEKPATAVDLASTITSENLQTLLRNTELVTELLQHVPSVEESSSTVPPSEQLRSTLASPQFQQALSMFSAALQSGQLGPVVQQFEVGPEAVDAANQGNMEEFVKALQKASISKDESSAQGTSRAPKEEEKKQPGGDEKRKKTDGGSGGSDKKDDDDEEWMTTD
ncbi:proteasomal ubiquitin receptor ADRM1 homolog isoform X3 [Schistocerca americana]|uniref:proteasomal ubiquitin receptor ADRM1 homolog isoform X3 n=1 Tax=Schistocerca americana TaxID=7009 RepID=UPI001F4F35AA|nr:proteasomal ubiquitin receptor ADRM1 homolog isoform X3 [Schistocerca americana]XP_047098965.1 proteasomal ubiquitin receptor ADRM1 homolog isoform X3 [Schistocerca piceifrons]XP_049786635.1 proteasomal ubiquitin receptor ADRM1 homolog isoform X3 [Schistocerca cancellata]